MAQVQYNGPSSMDGDYSAPSKIPVSHTQSHETMYPPNTEQGYNNGNADELERHILKRFHIQERLGKGAYGIVWKALDRKENRIVALKKIFDAFGNGQDAQRTFREVCFLTSFSVHPNIIKLTDIIRAENKNDLYLSFEYMPTDLHALIKSKSGLQDVHSKDAARADLLSPMDNHFPGVVFFPVRYIMAQLFRTLFFIHSANVIHRDLKPANILLTHPCEIRVADFGLARSLSDTDDNFQNGNLTNYVATRWYRSPEILLGSKRYTKGVDIWSLGTILAEMLRGKPLFTGENTIEQINFIRGAMNEPTTQDLRYCDSALVRSVFNYPPHRDFRRPLEHYMRGAPPEAVDLIRRLLHWDPDKRIDLMKAMRHPYVNSFYDPHLVYISDIAVTPFISDDKHFEDPSVYREALYEILHVRENPPPSATPKAQPTTLTPPRPPEITSAKRSPLAVQNDGDDVTLRSESPHGSTSSLEYEPLQTPLAQGRKPVPPPKKEPVKEPAPVKIEKPPPADPKNLPFGQPVAPGGNPLRHNHTPNMPQRRGAPARNGPANRQRITATVEQPAMTYKLPGNGSSGSLNTLTASNSPSPSVKSGQGTLTRTMSEADANDENKKNAGRKAVKFEDEVVPEPKKDGKGAKGSSGDGDSKGGTVGNSFAKRFSFDGRAIRDRLPYVKRSNSLARSPTPELARKFATNNNINNDKKTLKEAWRDTLAKSHVHMPDFLRRGSKGGNPSAGYGNPSWTANAEQYNSPQGSTTSQIGLRSRNGSFSNKNPASNQPVARTSSNTYGTMKTGLLQNLKGYRG